MEKTNVFMKIVKYIVPWKGDSVFEIIRKIVFIAALITLIVCGVSYLSVKISEDKDLAENEELRDLYSGVNVNDSVSSSQTPEDNSSGNTPIELPEEPEEPEILERFLPLIEINEDIVGWLSIGKDKFIDYAVLQTDNNDFYLSHNYKKAESRSGSLEVDYRCELSGKNKSENIVIYGHNMASGAYFGLLPRYFNYDVTQKKDDLSFYKNNPTLTFSTLYKSSEYKIFAGMLVKVNSGDDDFQYHRMHNFDSQEQFNDFCADILDRSTFITPDVDLEYGDNILTLSTCILKKVYGADVEKRWVLFAREVREGESPDVDVSKAYANPSPLFYDEYYESLGGSWKGRGWKEEIIKGYDMG